MKQYILPAALILSLSACGGEFKNPFEGLGKRPETTAPAASEPLSAINLPEDAVETTPLEAPASVEVSSIGQSAASLDQTTEAEKAAAKAVPTNATSQLGTTVASLGDPTEQGFWLRTPLVSEETQGSVETEGGAVVQVKLIPIEGAASAGSRISLAAMRALGLGLTDLATLKVSRL
ncbi:MAG: hypothetical protein ABJN34_11780 [Litoreibacter sp.]|uniref:hypothetical protein n=1 Tax=Litoreibacter sp. TaxID=1969459 RepID=UPI003296ADA2